MAPGEVQGRRLRAGGLVELLGHIAGFGHEFAGGCENGVALSEILGGGGGFGGGGASGRW